MRCHAAPGGSRPRPAVDAARRGLGRGLAALALGMHAGGCAADRVVAPAAEGALEILYTRGPHRSVTGEWPAGIYRVAADGGPSRPLVKPGEPGGRAWAPLPSPTGEWVAFARGGCCGDPGLDPT